MTAAVLQSTAGARADNGCTGAPRSEPANRARVEAVNERLELTLDDGRILRLAGLDPPRPTPDDPDLDQRGSARLADALVGRNVTVRLLDTRRDRWGRLPAEAYAAQGTAEPVSVAKTAIEAGLARFEPESSPRACRAALLAAESAARGAGLGLWADPYYAVLTTADHDAFAERAGSTIIVQGRVANVERNAYRTTLLFGARRGADFSVTILQRNLKQFIASGLDPEGLKGRTIRIRGLLDTRFGPQIEAANPDAIEALPLETEAGPPGTARQ